MTRGLTVTLNNHRDKLERFTYLSSFKGFKIYVSTPNEFPLLNQRGFVAPVGHRTLVALTPTVFEGDSSLEYVDVEHRKCLFSYESSTLTAFTEYSQSNCFLECAIKQIHELFLNNLTQPCIIWSLPIIYRDPICDDYTNNMFKNAFKNINVGKSCQHCLPDCSTIKYSHFVTTEKFRPCDEKNFGVSPFCKLKDLHNSTFPSHWLDQTMRQLGYEKFKDKFQMSAQRNYGNPYSWGQTVYDSFADDIAVVSFFYPSQRCMKIFKQASQTWAGYFATVGGASGLLIGVSAISLFELIWTFVRFVIILEPAHFIMQQMTLAKTTYSKIKKYWLNYIY